MEFDEFIVDIDIASSLPVVMWADEDFINYDPAPGSALA